MEASVAIQSLPAVADDEELCRIVDEVIAYIASSGFNYFVGPFETTIEGPYDEQMDIVKECQHIAVKAGAPAVAAYAGALAEGAAKKQAFEASAACGYEHRVVKKLTGH